MKDGELKLDSGALCEISESIVRYCASVKDCIDGCCRNVRYLQNEWADRETFDDNVLARLDALSRHVDSVMDRAESTYCRYYKDRAQAIDARPRFRGGSGASASTYSGGGATSANTKKDIKGEIGKIFSGTSDDIRRNIYSYLTKVRFVGTNGAKTSYYDPLGRTKRGLYRNIIAVDINSPTFGDDMLRLTSQHIFYNLRQSDRLRLIESFNCELQNNAHAHDARFSGYVDSLRAGGGLGFDYIDVSEAGYKEAMAFFAHAFKSYIADAGKTENEANKYFSHTYESVVDILKNMNSLN